MDYGIGFCDVGVVPGNQSDSFSKEELQQWRIDFIQRLRNHLKRVCREEHDDPKVHGNQAVRRSVPCIATLLTLFSSLERSKCACILCAIVVLCVNRKVHRLDRPAEQPSE